MKEEDKKKIEEIMSGLKCEKNYICANSQFELLCEAEDIGLDNYLSCLESDPQRCNFSLSFGDSYMCQCPIRVYLAKKLKK